MNASDPTLARRLSSAVPWALMVLFFFWASGEARKTQQQKQRTQDVRNEQRKRALMIAQTSNNAIVMCDSRHQVTLFNAKAEEMFGWSADKMVGQSIDILIPAGMRAEHARHMDAAANAMRNKPVDWEMTKVVESTAVHRDGHEFPVRMAMSALKYGNEVEFIARATTPDAPMKEPTSKPAPPLPVPVVPATPNKAEAKGK